MTKTVGIVCAVAVSLLLSGCGEQLASEAKKFADQVKEEATKTAIKKIDEYRVGTVEQLKQIRGEGTQGKADEKLAKKPAESVKTPAATADTKPADAKTTLKSDW
jgi:signal recognition particle GTPase